MIQTTERRLRFLRKALLTAAATAFCVQAIVFFLPSLQIRYEDIMMGNHPSFEKVYALGTLHFESGNPHEYDVARAQTLYRMALVIDPVHKGTRHQLARIAFLRGDFKTALHLIDEEIALPGGPVDASSHYVRGLILGYTDRFSESAESYEKFLRTDPKNWAGINDYAWVLIKAKRYDDALIALDWGLLYWPENPWLLNSKATVLFELKRYREAYDAVQTSAKYVASVTPQEWSHAYPGNDPLIARQGVASFQKAVFNNMHTIESHLGDTQKGVR